MDPSHLSLLIKDKTTDFTNEKNLCIFNSDYASVLAFVLQSNSMAKGFIDAPQEGEGVQWSECVGPSRQNTQVTQTGQGGIARHTPVTPEDEHTDDGTISSASSQENIPPLSSSAQTPHQQSTASLESSSVPSHSMHSPNFQASSPTLSSPTDQSASSSSHSPSLASSSQLPSQLTWPSTPSFPALQSSPIHSPPYPPAQPSPYQQAPSMSVQQLNEQALQDSANNNVDENSNEQYDRYANANYHQDYAQVQYNPDQSVRPRVRREAGPVREEEPDCTPRRRLDIDQRTSSEEGYMGFHRRNLSEGHACTSRGSQRDNISGYPLLPNLNTSSGKKLLVKFYVQ